jgi:hypothetical protein
LEQSVESIRLQVGVELFRSFRTFDETIARSAEKAFRLAVHGADKRKQPFYFRIVWGFLKDARYGRLADAARKFQSTGERLGLGLPAEPPTDQTLEQWLNVLNGVEERIEAAARMREYFHRLEQLTASKALEEVTREHRELVD